MYTLILFLLAVFSLYIGAWAFVRWDASWLRNLNTIPVQILMILIVCIFLCASCILIYRLLQKQNEQRLKALTLICMVLLFLGQLAFLLLIRPMLRYDPLKTFDMAVEMLQTHTISGTYETGYFARYTNNYPITILTYWFLLLLSKWGISPSFFMPAVQLVNIACITGSIWLGYLILKELKGQRISVFYLLLCVLCPLSYVWAGFFYTTTVSTPCLMGILYLYLRLSKTKTPAHRTLLGGILGVVLILGYKLRATSVIAFLAALLVSALQLGKLRGFPFSALLKKYVGCAAAFLITAALSLGLFHTAVEHYVAFDYKNTGFPIIHWIAMSARWEGSFDQMDELYTSGFATKEEKIDANKKVLMERIREAGSAGLAALAGRKLLNTWADGTDGYLTENSYAAYGKAYDYILGNQSGFLTLYSQAFRAFQMLAIGLSAIAGLLRLRRQKKSPELFLLQLTLLGGMVFHLIWEANPQYSISFTFLGFMLLADALALLTDEACTAGILKKGPFACTGAFVMLFLFLMLGKQELVDTPMERWNYCVNQYQYAGGTGGYVKDYKQSYIQTFTTDRPFNRIAVRCVNPVGEYNQSAFTVKVCSPGVRVRVFNFIQLTACAKGSIT